MLDIFRGLKNLIKVSHFHVDSPVFRLHYSITVMMLIAFSLIVTTRQYVGNPIDCVHTKEIPEDVLNTFCWIHSTYTLKSAFNKTVGRDVPFKGVDNSRGRTDDQKYYRYYQWVCFCLFFQSLMLAGNEFQSLGRAIVKEDEYEEVRWDGIVSIVSWRERVFGLWWEERAEIRNGNNLKTYIQTLVKLRRALRDKRHNADDVKPLHDNAAVSVREKINKFDWEVLQHPPYSPDLAPSDFHLFGLMKKFLTGHRFATDAEVQSTVRKWLYSNRTDFYEQGILKLVPRWEKYVEKLGAYIEK
ncbi:hypothetical protein ANN_25545 [Periplaneta americana]|uniref:Innexin n=1 Tax=Periplaneta americana TaxID=6978 RepID=A0ABQ8S1R9_PERAM|nr:hypothetical protein ANN_25545 [Periplaneta americana]